MQSSVGRGHNALVPDPGGRPLGGAPPLPPSSAHLSPAQAVRSADPPCAEEAPVLSSPPPAGLRPACPRGVPEPDRASLPCGAATVLPAQPRNPPPELVPETAGRLGGWSLSLGRACVFPVPGAYQVLSDCLLKEGKVPRARTLHFRSRSYRLVEYLASNGVPQTRGV